jgi:hypothetical protein
MAPRATSPRFAARFKWHGRVSLGIEAISVPLRPSFGGWMIARADAAESISNSATLPTQDLHAQPNQTRIIAYHAQELGTCRFLRLPDPGVDDRAQCRTPVHTRESAHRAHHLSGHEEVVRVRTMLLLCLLSLAACTIREETFGVPDEESHGSSFVPLNLDNPTGADDDLACTGGFARGSRIDEYRDGSASLFCQ